MKRLALAAIAALAVAAGSLGAGGVEPAAAATHTIDISAPASANVGQPVLIRASGTAATLEEWWDISYIEVVAIPAEVTGECPPGAQSGAAVAANAGGRILAIALRPSLDAAGNFANSVGFTAGGPGTALICGYLYDEVGFTYAWDSLTIGIGSAASGGTGAPGSATTGSATPVDVSRPRVTGARRRLVCHHGVWSNASGAYAYRWLLDGRPTRVTGSRATVTRAARGHAVSCRVTAAGSGGSATATSRPLRLP